MKLNRKLIPVCISNKGFTIVELILSMGMSLVVLGAIYSTFRTQQKSYLAQTEVVAMQQNIRAGMFMMEREIRMAGCDPTGNAGAGIVTANSNSITFTMDINDNLDTYAPDGDATDTNENITYDIYTSTADGIQKLGRQSPSTANRQPAAENIEALNFVYRDGSENVLNSGGSGLNAVPASDISQIRSIEITMVARTDQARTETKNTTAYSNQLGDVIFSAPNDNFRRQLLTTRINCRNLGL